MDELNVENMTLKQTQEYCEKFIRDNGMCNQGIGCILHETNCCEKAPCQWKLKRHKITKKELQICNDIGAKWITKNGTGEYVHLWEFEPNEYIDNSDVKFFVGDGFDEIATMCGTLFPSIKQSDCVNIYNVITT